MTGEVAGDVEAYLLTGLAVPAEIERLHDLLARVGTEHPDLSPTDLMLFETAVIEIANNVVEHGQPPGQVSWTFRLEVHVDRLEAVLSDDGQAFQDTVSATMPDALAESGRGIALADAALDHLSYVRREDVNHWSLVRQRT